MRKYFLFALALLAASPVLFGQEGDALPFTRIDRNPVTSALAGSGSASLGNTAYSAFSNASILPFYTGKMDAAVSTQYWAPSLSFSMHANVGIACKISPRVGLSAGYAWQGGTMLDQLDEYGQPAGSFFPQDHLAALGLGIGLGEHFSVGVNVRHALQKVTEKERFSGFSGDLFAMYEPNGRLRFTAGVSTLGARLHSSDGASFRQPASAKAGACWSVPFTDAHILSLTADADYYFSGKYSAAAGVEYAWNSTVFVRGGYRYASPGCVIPSHLGLGLGVNIFGFHLDISYLTASPSLGNTFSAGLGYRF